MSISASQVKELREKTGVGMMECKKALTEAGGDLEAAVRLLRERGLSRAAKKAGRVAAEGLVVMSQSSDRKSAVLLEVNCETDFVTKNDDFKSFVDSVAALAIEKNVATIDELKSQSMKNGKTVEAQLTELIATIGENMTLRRLQSIAAKNGIIVGYNHMGGKIGALVAIEGGNDDQAESVGKDIAMHVAASNPRYLKSDEVDRSELEQEKEIARKKLKEEGKPEDLIEKILMGQMNKFYKEICLLDQAFVKDPALSITKFLKQSGDLKVSGFVRFQLGEGIEKKQENFADEVAATLKQ